MKPIPSVDAVMFAAAALPGLACFDTGLKTTLVTWGAGPMCTQLSEWQSFVRHHCQLERQPGTLFTGGVIGWLGYEAGKSVEKMPSPLGPRATHDVCLWRTNGGMTFDHEAERWSIGGTPAFKKEATAVMENAIQHPLAQHTLTTPSAWEPRNNLGQSTQFQKGVDSVLSAIKSGDVYQVNLAWEQTNIPIENGLQAWLTLRSQNPALRGCYLKMGKTEVVSNSPELFLHIDGSNQVVSSMPIKGTAPVSGGEQAKNALDTSPKEKAELTMIVDLVRNDLGRVAVPGTVQAGKRTLRQCGDLWHAEQLVTAKLEKNKDVVDVMSATFPPGSVTGAPKVRAMEVIHALEKQPRGVYTGTLGWFADGGSAHFNVAIRTATIQAGVGRFHVGAGIVADSKPVLEWHETLAKAKALAACLEA